MHKTPFVTEHALESKAFALGASRMSLAQRRALLSAKRCPLVAPVAATSIPGEASLWAYDAELGGVRAIAARDGDIVTLHAFDASGEGQRRAVEAFYPAVVRALRALPLERVVLDGELVAFDASGQPSSAVIERVAKAARGEPQNAPIVLVANDLLVLGEADVRRLPLVLRRDLLASLLPAEGVLRAAPLFEGELATLLSFCAAHGMRGLIAKPKSSPYTRGATTKRRHADVTWLHLPARSSPPRSSPIRDGAPPDADLAERRVTMTNRTKVFWPGTARDAPFTKGDLCDYYASVEDALLPYLRRRPVIVVRYPDGIHGKSFFQWNVPPGMPSWVRTLTVEGDDGAARRGFLVDDAATLLYLANLACIPLHILACRTPHLDQAEFFTVDFDVKQSELRHAVTLARRLHQHLEAVGLPSFAKTSGQSGLHVLVPLGEAQSFTTARALADLLGRLLVAEFPALATMDRAVARRGPRVYVDTGQTGQTRAIVAPWSVRAAPGATVSTPLRWEEVTSELDPQAFTMRTVPKRLRTLGDPMRSLLDAKPDVPRAVALLGEVLGGQGAGRG